jgi:hypothetical protein
MVLKLGGVLRMRNQSEGEVCSSACEVMVDIRYVHVTGSSSSNGVDLFETWKHGDQDAG